MHKAIVVMLLFAASGRAMAEWTQVATNDASTVYADPSSISRAGSIAKMWHLIDFKSVQSRPYGLPYWSQKTHQEYDCAQARERTLEFQHYSENMGAGDVTHADADPGNWKAVVPATASAARMDLACAKP